MQMVGRQQPHAVVEHVCAENAPNRWQFDIHGRTTEKDNGQTRWRYRYDGEHRLTDVISEPRDRNKPQVHVSFSYDLLSRQPKSVMIYLLNLNGLIMKGY